MRRQRLVFLDKQHGSPCGSTFHADLTACCKLLQSLCVCLRAINNDLAWVMVEWSGTVHVWWPPKKILDKCTPLPVPVIPESFLACQENTEPTLCLDLGSFMVGILDSIIGSQGSNRGSTVADLLQGIGSSTMKVGWASLRSIGQVGRKRRGWSYSLHVDFLLSRILASAVRSSKWMSQAYLHYPG